MKLTMIILPILLAACVSNEPIKQEPIKEPEKVVEPVKEKQVSDYYDNDYPQYGWHKDYTEVVNILQKQMPIDSPCPNFEVFLKAIVSAESSFNNKAYYMEPPPLSIYSIGFFQLSVSDGKIYGCAFKTERDVEHPIKNIECAYKIFARLKKNNPQENIWEYSGRYWAVTRWDRYSKWKGKNQAGFLRMKSYANKNGCVF